MKIFVANLDFKITEAQFRDIFLVFGPISDCRLIAEKTGKLKSKGYGFISYLQRAHALRAIKMLDGSTISGRTIVVREAGNKKPSSEQKPKRPRLVSLSREA